MNKNECPSPEKKRPQDRFFLLTLSTILLLAVGPFIAGYQTLKFLIDVFFGFILLSAIYSIRDASGQLVLSKKLLIDAFLALSVMISLIAKYFVRTPYLEGISYLLTILFIAFTIFTIGRFIAGQTTVTRDVLYAAVALYLLMGILWSMVYTLLEYFSPGSFKLGNEYIQDKRILFIYYSFVTLTTLGYGDITPITAKACSLSILEAIIGQLYLVIQVAWLVGMYTSRSYDQRR